MSPGQCNTGLTTPRHAEYQIINLIFGNITPLIKRCSPKFRCGRGSRVVWVSDRGLPCHEFEPSTTKDPPCRAAMHIKSVES
ncbi:hypothetical protein TNCV_1257131 [Trichonephila clavipes]|nr:hypothetical protein TNCV_1257131 [Trichonephila clavipes]